MTYSVDTMRRMEASLARASNALLGVGVAAQDAAEAMSDLPNIGDTCCGHCGPGLCYVDGVTGA